MLNANLIYRLTDIEADCISCLTRTPDGLKLERMPTAVILGALVEVGRHNPARRLLF